MQDDLGEIKSYNFNSKLLLAIDSRWIDYFNSKEPIFKAIIQNGKYVLIGPKVNPEANQTNQSSSKAEVDTSE